MGIRSQQLPLLAEGFCNRSLWGSWGLSRGLSCPRQHASSGFAFEEPNAQALQDICNRCVSQGHYCPQLHSSHTLWLPPTHFHPELWVQGDVGRGWLQHLLSS